MKQKIYRLIRKNRLVRKIRDLSNFLSGTEIGLAGVPEKARSLVLAPHQDDESIGCGGTLNLLTRAGGSFDVVYLSDGQAGGKLGIPVTDGYRKDLQLIRKKEAEMACAVLGASRLYFLGGTDSQLHLETDLSEKIAELLRQQNYDLIFCPWPHESHSDHAAAFSILQSALRMSPKRNLKIWPYEVWTPLIPNRIIDISKAFETKRKAISLYKSQMENTDYAEAFTGLARYRSIQVPGAKYAEAFLEGDADFILSLR